MANFKVGDIITGKQHNGYSYTDDNSLLLVKEVYLHEMQVIILCHNETYGIGDSAVVANTKNRFEYATIADFKSKNPDCHSLDEETIKKLLERYPKQEEEEDATDDENDVLPHDKKKELTDEIITLLKKYHYHPTEEGVHVILDEWYKNKKDLIHMFEKHPNYNGNYQIAFDHDFSRVMDRSAINNFRHWLNSDEVESLFYKKVKIGVFTYGELTEICNRLYDYIYIFDRKKYIKTINGKTVKEYFEEYNHFNNLKLRYKNDSNVFISCNEAYAREGIRKIKRISNLMRIFRSDCFNQFVNNEAEDYFTRAFPEAKIKAGQKMSRAINKILCLLGVDKAPNYNKEFAKFSDAINPLKIKRHTVISIHPVDYLTMSFGNSWSSCHTIDKRNDRGIDSEHNYRGCNSSGTESYMLDGTSCIFYTVDAKHDGNHIELADKINRNMFHYYDNRLLQGRVYPQSNDSGANDLYRDIREIVQKVFADMLGIPNYWTNKSGTYACDFATLSTGTHYRDYENFDTCNVSTLKDDRDCHNPIKIGHYPICPCCGEEHDSVEYIECDYCQ